MTKLIVKTSRKAGLSPGSLIHIGEKRLEKIRIFLVDFDESHLTEMPVESPEAMLPFLPEPSVTWLNICGIHDTKIIEDLEKQFQIHPLTLEDIVNTAQRPKVESYDHYLFVVLNTFRYDPGSNAVTSEQISLILGENYLITFQETASTIFDNVLERLRKGTRIRKRGADYLAYGTVLGTCAFATGQLAPRGGRERAGRGDAQDQVDAEEAAGQSDAFTGGVF